jgi:hypothetical protein
MTPLAGVLFILGPFIFFCHLCLLNAIACVATLMFPAFSSTQPSVWLTLSVVSFIGIFYLFGAWGFTEGNYITKKHAVVLCTFQSLIAFALYYFLLPTVEVTGGFAYLFSIVLIILQVWSILTKLLLLQEKMLLMAVSQ